jgi:hypothetical protein
MAAGSRHLALGLPCPATKSSKGCKGVCEVVPQAEDTWR